MSEVVLQRGRLIILNLQKYFLPYGFFVSILKQKNDIWMLYNQITMFNMTYTLANLLIQLLRLQVFIIMDHNIPMKLPQLKESYIIVDFLLVIMKLSSGQLSNCYPMPLQISLLLFHILVFMFIQSRQLGNINSILSMSYHLFLSV